MQNVKQANEPKTPGQADEISEILRRAREGDSSTLPALKKMVEDPIFVDSQGGDLAHQAQESFIAEAAGKNLALSTSINRKLANLRLELAGPNPTPVERLLVERIVACWLQVNLADIRFAQARDLTIRQGEYHEHRMDRTQRRYLSAIKTLAVVRKLAIPILQVNIAKKQTNVAGACVIEQGGKQ